MKRVPKAPATAPRTWRQLTDAELADIARQFLEGVEIGVLKDSPSVREAWRDTLQHFNQLAALKIWMRRSGGRAGLKWNGSECLRLYAMVRRCEFLGVKRTVVLSRITDAYRIPGLKSGDSVGKTFQRAEKSLIDWGLLKLADHLVKEELKRGAPLLPQEFPLLVQGGEAPPWVPSGQVLELLAAALAKNAKSKDTT